MSDDEAIYEVKLRLRVPKREMTPPHTWDWHSLLDLEHVSVLASAEIHPVFEALALFFGELARPVVHDLGSCTRCRFLMGRMGLNGYGRCGDCQKAVFKETEERIAREQKKYDAIPTGTRIRIRIGSKVYTGKSFKATFWSPCDGWYIEFYHDDDGRYGYWKQGPDGGTVEVIP